MSTRTHPPRRRGQWSSTPDRRARCLRAASALFASKGLADTTIDDICRESGLSVGSVYHLFDGKDAIAAALYVEAIAHYQAEVLRVLARARDAEAGVTALVRHVLRWVEADPARAGIMLAVEHARIRDLARDEVDALNAAFLPRFTAWFEACAASGAIAKLPPDVLVSALFGAVHRFARLWLDGHAHTSIARAATLLAEHAWNGLRPRR